MSDILMHFCSEFDFTTSKTIFKCKYCPIKYTHKNVTKMRKHIDTKCTGKPLNMIQSRDECNDEEESSGLCFPETSMDGLLTISILENVNISNADVLNAKKDRASSSSPGPASASPGSASLYSPGSVSSFNRTPIKRKIQERLDKFVDFTSKDEQNFLQEKLATAIYTSKSLFRLVENKELVQLFAHIKPSFKLPTAKALSTTLLDKCYNKMKETVDTCVRESPSFLSIQVDGWSDMFLRSIFNFIINTPRPVFVEFLDTKTSHHTSACIAEETKKVMQKYSSKPERFSGIITDNASAMIAAAKLLLNDYPALIRMTCFSHSLNLLVGDILKLKSVEDVLKNVTSITNAVRNSSIIRAQFAQICKDKKVGVSLVLPCATRWSSNCRSIENMISLKLCLQVLAVGSSELKELDVNRSKKNKTKITDLLLSTDFWDKLEKFLGVIKPIVDVIMKIQTDEPNIHTIYPLFCKIEAGFPEATILNSMLPPNECERICEQFRNRREQFVTPLYWAAYFFDPNHDPALILPGQHIDVTEFINDLCEKLTMDNDETGEVLAELINYKSKNGIFSKSFIWKIKDKVSPMQWWENIPSKLSPIALRILSLPATSCATERSFSMMKDVQQRKRNRLLLERVGKLTYISLNDKLLAPKEIRTPIKKTTGNVSSPINKSPVSLSPLPGSSHADQTQTQCQRRLSSNNLYRNKNEDSTSTDDSESDSNNFSVHDSSGSDGPENFSDSELEYDDIVPFF